MPSITATAARKDLYGLINQVNESCTPAHITNTRGKGAVLVGEDDWATIKETLYLNSIPDMSESLPKGMDEPLESCVDEDNLNW